MNADQALVYLQNGSSSISLQKIERAASMKNIQFLQEIKK